MCSHGVHVFLPGTLQVCGVSAARVQTPHKLFRLLCNLSSPLLLLLRDLKFRNLSVFDIPWSSRKQVIRFLHQGVPCSHSSLELVCLQHHSSNFSPFDSSAPAYSDASEGRAVRLHLKMWGWQLHLFIMWGTVAHLEMQPELVFSLILAPTQRARINSQGGVICGHGIEMKQDRSISQALNLTAI